MSSRSLVSILTPVYNHTYIEHTIQSVLNQTYEDWEWIILDDGSDDGSAEIIHSFKDSRIHYSYQDHVGFPHLSSTFNKALTLCTADLVAMLDSDDYWPAYKLAVQIPTLDDPDVVLSYGESTLVNPQGKKIGTMGIPEDPSIALNDPVGSALKILLLPYCFLATSTIAPFSPHGQFRGG